MIGYVKLGFLDLYIIDLILEENLKWFGLIDYFKVKVFVEVIMVNIVFEGL